MKIKSIDSLIPFTIYAKSDHISNESCLFGLVQSFSLEKSRPWEQSQLRENLQVHLEDDTFIKTKKNIRKFSFLTSTISGFQVLLSIVTSKSI